jgi:Protein phosphatase 2C
MMANILFLHMLKMKIHTLLQIGEHHTNHCEDSLVSEQIGSHQWLCAVMDGCTMGIDSHLISTLMGKVLRKIAKNAYFREFMTKKQVSNPILLKAVCQQLFLDLNDIKNQVQLERDETLSTLILMILDTQKWEASVITVGDGVIVCNAQVIEYQQDNKPDYLGYHLTKNFETWFAHHTQFNHFQAIKDISMATDGILTFSRFDNRVTIVEKDAIAHLLIDNQWIENDKMLHLKMLKMQDEWGLKPTDDLGIIRVVQGAHLNNI